MSCGLACHEPLTRPKTDSGPAATFQAGIAMDMRLLELLFLTVLAGISAVAALIHGDVLFGACFGSLWAFAATQLIWRLADQ
jgi:hypothetical protein